MARELDVGWLRVFDAVGRLGSLTRAAESLGLSQPAVSYQMRRLEEQLGATLFRRHPRGITLSEEGELLFRAVRSGLDRIDEAARQIRRPAAAPVVRLHTDYGFATFWLMPRVPEFRRRHPGVEVRILASQALGDALDGADIAALFGRRRDLPADAVLVMPERVVPVCGPGFLARLDGDAGALARAPLLHLDSPPGSRWFTWASWLATQGLSRAPGPGDLHLNTYGMVIQAALAEQGVALGWIGLIDSLLDSGTLVRAGPEVPRPDCGYWLREQAPATATTALVRRWLLAEMGL